MAASTYFGTVAAHAEAEAQRQRDQQEAARASQRAIFTAVLGNPNATADQRAYAIDNLNKLNQGAGSKKGQSPYDTLGDHITRVGQHLQDAGHPEASNPGVLHTLPKLDGSVEEAAAPTAMAPAQQGTVQNLPPVAPAQTDFQAPSVDGKAPDASGGAALPPAATADAPPVANAPDKQPAAPPISAASGSPASLPPISPDAAHTIGPNAPIGTPAHAFATGVKHGAGKVLSFIGNRLNAAQAGYSEPGINLPPLAPNIDAAMIPSPMPPVLKFDTNPLEGAALVASNPGATDRFGQPLDDSKKYVAAPDPKGSVMINGRPFSVQPFVIKPSSAAPRSLGTTISMDDAQQLEQSGAPILSTNGKPFDLSKIPANMKFQAVGLPGGQTAYILGTEKQVKRTNGNENYIVNEFEQADPSKYVATGVARVGSTSAQPGERPDGTFGINVKTTTPGTSGMVGARPQSLTPLDTPVSAAQNLVHPATGVDLATPHGATGIAAPRPPRAITPQAHQAGAPAVASTSAQNPVLTVSQAHQIQQTTIPVREAMTQIFGDPEIPNMPSLAQFGDIVKDPAASQRVGNAVRSILDRINSGANDEGGILQAVKNAGGLAAWEDRQKNSVVADQLKGMPLREQQMVNGIISAYSGLIGVRSLTKASAAKFSAEALERDIPIPGLNVTSPEAYYDKLGKIGEMIRNGTKSSAGFTDAERQHMTDSTNRMFSLSQDGGEQATSGKAVSLKAAMALPINTGKTADQVTADIKAHGHEVRP